MSNLEGWAGLAVPVGLIVLLTAIGLWALAYHLKRVLSAGEAVLVVIETVGQAIIRLKDDRLERWVGKIPIPADVLTVSRLLLIGIALDCHLRGQARAAAWWFVGGWLTDVLDGLKARDTARRTGRPTGHGKYLDPIIDFLCFGLMAAVLAKSFPRPLMGAFLLTLAARATLFALLFVGRRWWNWKRRLPSDILPASIAGRFKTVFIGLSFGLIILDSSNRQPDLAWRFLAVACALELVSLGQQSRRVWRRLRAPLDQIRIVPLRPTGTD